MKREFRPDPGPRRPHHPYQKDQQESRAETTLPAYLGIKSSSTSPKGAGEAAAMKELETLVRGLMERVELPQVWENRLNKQLRNIEKARANDSVS